MDSYKDQLINEHLKYLERRIEKLEQKSIPPKPLNRSGGWTTFETELLQDHLNQKVADLAAKLGRTDNSIVWKMISMLRKMAV